MIRKPSARWGLGFMGLILAAGTVTAQAAPPQNSSRSRVNRPVPRVQRNPMGQRNTVRTANPARQMTMSQWARIVQTQIPTLDKVDREPFAIEQERRFDRGETRVNSSVHTF